MPATKGGKPNTTKGGKPSTKAATPKAAAPTKPNPVVVQAEAMVDTALEEIVVTTNMNDLITHLEAGPVSVSVSNLPTELIVNATFSDEALKDLGTIAVNCSAIAEQLRRANALAAVADDAPAVISTEEALRVLHVAALSGETITIGDLPAGLSLIWDTETDTAKIMKATDPEDAAVEGWTRFVPSTKTGWAITITCAVLTVGTVLYVRKRRSKRAAAKATAAVDNGIGEGLYEVPLGDDMSAMPYPA
jgi:hypothetical protein